MENENSKRIEISPRILILSDGKPGHYNQSLGIIDRLSDVCAETIQIKFKRKWRDNLIRVTMHLLGGIKLPDGFIKAMLTWGLDNSSTKSLLKADKFDIILSAGSSVAPINLLLGRLTGAKTVVCTRPSPLGIKHFDLALLPEHSRPRRIPKNVVMTFGVPNRITLESVEKAGTELSRQVGISGNGVIGVLLGGDDPYYRISPDMAHRLCNALSDISRQTNMRIALTTSRRTDTEAENVIESKLRDQPYCCLLVSARSGGQKNIVSGILGISDITIVTEDSFSMVCESASSGKKIMILNVERKKGVHPKRERVYRLIVERGYARRTDLSDLNNKLLDFIKDTSQTKALNDSQIAADSLRQLLGI
ncbi:MAG: hypothetical protein QG641_1320 [Candidatus Poribacteria bacterium]|nr:hypothetical protein [Candidatus Poribacteria bacterium]